MNDLEKLFAEKETENGDLAYNTTGDPLVDLLFMTPYFEKNLDEVEIGTSNKEKLFAMFVRDPRYGLGRRDLGRRLMYLAEESADSIVKAGRYDDLYKWIKEDNMPLDPALKVEYLNKLLQDVLDGNELAKKWMPRFGSSEKAIARFLAQMLEVNKQQYGKLVKTKTAESMLSSGNTAEINFAHLPSLALKKYFKAFSKREDTAEKFAEYLDDVKKGKKNMNTSLVTVYDILKNSDKIDADLYWDKLEKTPLDVLPILDTSGSMTWGDYGRGVPLEQASAIAYYLAKNSINYKDYVISFSRNPTLIKIDKSRGRGKYRGEICKGTSNFANEVNSMYTGECANTDFGKVMELLKRFRGKMPQYLVVLSDMEFDCGSNQSKEELQEIWKENGYTTKIVWWNFNSRNKTVPETDEMGNIYMSGYNPQLLKYLECGFDGKAYLNKLLATYVENLRKSA